MTYTPVTKETFAKWCDQYKERMRKLKEEMRSDADFKPTGREIFEQSKKIIQEINLEDEDYEEFKEEEATNPDEEEDNF